MVAGRVVFLCVNAVYIVFDPAKAFNSMVLVFIEFVCKMCCGSYNNKLSRIIIIMKLRDDGPRENSKIKWQGRGCRPYQTW